REGKMGLYRKAADPSATEELLFRSDEIPLPTGCSPDGKMLLYQAARPKTAGERGILLLPLVEPHKPVPLWPGTSARFSPDGRWIVYSSAESLRVVVYAAPFHVLDGKEWIALSSGAAM